MSALLRRLTKVTTRTYCSRTGLNLLLVFACSPVLLKLLVQLSSGRMPALLYKAQLFFRWGASMNSCAIVAAD